MVAQPFAGGRVEGSHVDAAGPLAAEIGAPVVGEVGELHADGEQRLAHVGKARRAPCRRQLAWAGHRPHEGLRPLPVGLGVEHGGGVEEHPLGHHAAARVPHGGGHDGTRPGHAPHLGDRVRRPWHEMQHQQRQDGIEASVRVRHGAGVADLEVGSGGVRAAARVGDIVGREIQPRDAGRRRPAQDGGGQVAGATAEVEAIAVDRPDEVEEQLGQAAAPAPHLQLVGVAVGGVEARGIAHAVLRMRGRGRWAMMPAVAASGECIARAPGMDPGLRCSWRRPPGPMPTRPCATPSPATSPPWRPATVPPPPPWSPPPALPARSTCATWHSKLHGPQSLPYRRPTSSPSCACATSSPPASSAR